MTDDKIMIANEKYLVMVDERVKTAEAKKKKLEIDEKRRQNEPQSHLKAMAEHETAEHEKAEHNKE